MTASKSSRARNARAQARSGNPAVRGGQNGTAVKPGSAVKGGTAVKPGRGKARRGGNGGQHAADGDGAGRRA